jgi:hypothetical protein
VEEAEGEYAATEGDYVERKREMRGCGEKEERWRRRG